MINPKFAAFVSVILALIVIYVGYLLFGNSIGSAVKSLASQPAVVATPVINDVDVTEISGTEVAQAQPTDQLDEAPIVEPTSTEAPTEAPAPPVAPAAPTDTPAPQVEQPAPTSTPEPPAAPTEAPAPAPTDTAAPVEAANNSRTVKGVYYDAYVDAATKTKQYYHYTCEFDAAWVVLKTNGIDATLQDQIDIVGIDNSVEPTYNETADGTYIYGGDILQHYSGNYETNFMARSTGNVIRRIFEHYGLKTATVNTRKGLEAALRRNELVWIKTTADFKPGRDVLWVMPDGTTYATVLGNDHAVVVMGYNEEGALIRDVLGPTSTNWKRTYEYVVPWEKFMAAWGQQQNDGIAVSK